MKYLVIDILEIIRNLKLYNVKMIFDEYIQNRRYFKDDIYVIFGECEIIKNNSRFIIRCKNAILYSYDSVKFEMKITKLTDYNETIFWKPNNETNNCQFENICDLIEKTCIQETTKEGYEQSLGPEIGEEISKLINRL